MKRRFGKERKKGRKLIIVFLLIIAVAGYIYYITDKNIKPTIAAMSEIRARLIATQAINDSVSQKMASKAFDNLMTVKTDNNGKVTMVQANTAIMNKLAVETSLAIQNQIKDISTKDLKIPISNIIGSQLLANAGPSININIQPAGSVNVDFSTEFEEAGINQTRLKIYLLVKTEVQIIAPLASNKIDVSTHIPVSETIIVSDVTLSYMTG